MQQMPNFAAVNSNRVDKGWEMVVCVVGCQLRGGYAVKDAVVIMTLSGMPMGGAHSLSTGEIIFY